MTFVIPSLAQADPPSSVKHNCVLNSPEAKTGENAERPQHVVSITDNQGTVYFTVNEISGDSELSLAKHLNEIDAVMYDAFWCPHCYQQKQLFGAEALSLLNFVECDLKGVSAQPDVCQRQLELAGAALGSSVGFPTWEINGKFYAGTQTLEELAKHSGYQGPMNFQNPIDTQIKTEPLEIFKPPAPPPGIVQSIPSHRIGGDTP